MPMTSNYTQQLKQYTTHNNYNAVLTPCFSGLKLSLAVGYLHKKCQTIQIGSRALLSKRLRQQSAPEYRIGDNFIPNVDSLTDQGITGDRNVKFSEQYQQHCPQSSISVLSNSKMFYFQRHSKSNPRKGLQNLRSTSVCSNTIRQSGLLIS